MTTTTGSTGHSLRNPNAGTGERIASVIIGTALALYGMKQKRLSGTALTAVGSGLIYRGIMGQSGLSALLGIGAGERPLGPSASVQASRALKVEHTVVIERSPEELYRFWRQLENLPQIMRHIESVRVIDERRSHWVAKGPAGMRVAWTATIINDVPNKLIAWRSLEDADVAHAGSVNFRPVAGGTEVKVELAYELPGGSVASLIAKLFGEKPEQQIKEDLLQFKRFMEQGRFSAAGGRRG